MSNNKRVATFSIEDTLPSLPLPSLNETLNKYLESAKVFLNGDEYAKTEAIVRDFEFGVGAQLHVSLSEKAKNERNWLEKWWLEWGYLEWRLPIVPFSNTSGMYFERDYIVNRTTPNGTNVQLATASLITHYALRFFEELRKETIPVDLTRLGYFSMQQYRGLYCTTRIPCKKMDRLDVHFRTYAEGTCSNNIVVMFKHRFYLLNVFHPTDGTLLNVNELYQKLTKLVSANQDRPYGVGIGALTADYRETWADNLRHLYDLDGENETKMRQVQESIFVLVLDETSPDTHDEMNTIGLCGNAKNRFFDKSIQIIVTKNGYTPFNTDHTPFDGITSVNMAHWAQCKMKQENANDIGKVKQFPVRDGLDDPIELDFVSDSKIEEAIGNAVEVLNKNGCLMDHRLCNLAFCGKSHLKNYKIHPDTFIQMCLQLAYYRLHQKFAPTYETATARAYYHGRTETQRSCTQEAVDWVKAMCDENTSKAEQLSLFKIACKKHDTNMDEAVENRGCDRHLLGLRLTAQALNMELPEIYKDASWKKSGGDGNFIISSSCVGFTDLYGGCFPMCENGYGIFYRIGDNGTTLYVSNYVTSSETDCVKMQESISASVKIVQALFEQS